MTDFPALFQRTQQAGVLRALRESNALSARFGLSLTEEEIAMLAARRLRALRDTGRVELGAGVLGALAHAFCDSPFVTRDAYAGTLAALQDAFYYFKNETEDAVSDEELIAFMKAAFDGPAQGDLTYLTGTSLEALRRLSHGGDPLFD